jgi:O-antigen ligase
LEATRHFLNSIYDVPGVPHSVMNDPAYQRRMASNRIFSTLSNPDAYAAAIELLLPLTLAFLWQIIPKVRTPVRSLFVIILGGVGLASLYWTGSKAGWIVTAIMAVIAVAHSRIDRKWKTAVVAAIVIAGVGALAFRYSSDVTKQQVSVGSRIGYWRAAIHIFEKRPFLGTGPGTFSVPYAALKSPSEDFARLCHNDYLEQACDSGFFGFLAYLTMIIGCLFWLYRYRFGKKQHFFNPHFGACLGIFGFCLHSAVDYPLYTAALAWPMFFLLGILLNF